MAAKFVQHIKDVLKRSPIPLTKNQMYDKQTQRIIREVLNPDGNAIDVGCFKGEILDLMVQAAPMGRHFAFEPIPSYCEALKIKYQHLPGVHVHNAALGDMRGKAKFNYVTSNPSYSGLKKREYDRPNEVDTEIEVQVERLDDLIPDDLRIDLIKIDVEGAERLVLEGGRELLERCRPTVVFEHGLGAADIYDSDPGELFDLLGGHELSVTTLKMYLSNREVLTREEFERQFHEKQNYYFVAFPGEASQ